MSDDTQHDETQPVRPQGAAAPTESDVDTAAPADAPAEAPAAGTDRRGFRERLRTLRRSGDGSRTFGLAALIASALAGIIVGGLGSVALHAVTHDGERDRGGWVQRHDRGDGEFGGPGPMQGGPRGVPGLVPPTTPPEDEGSAS
jgi:hypothetical protein